MKKHLLLLVFLFLGSVTLLHSQITGTVKDEDGTPLPGAS
ncbi:MAG: Cna protein B-type domain protein, partial [Eudoraea sp.]|nr:Cna protein B-type domain protein [Eudoraea sp.]